MIIRCVQYKRITQNSIFTALILRSTISIITDMNFHYTFRPNLVITKSSPPYNLLRNVTFYFLPSGYFKCSFANTSIIIQSQWRCALRLGSATARLLKLRFRIPPAAWFFFFVIVCCQLEVPVTGRSLVQMSPIKIDVSLP